MGWLNSEKPPEKWSNSYFKIFVERLRTALNYLDAENFPDGISGLWLRDRSVSLQDKVTGYGGLIIPLDFFAGVVGHNVTSTTETTLGSPILWTPRWNSLADAYLEVTCYVSNASHPATIKVNDGIGTILTQEVSNTTIQRLETKITPMSQESGTLVFRVKVAHASYPLTITSARIILKLTE